MDFLPEIRFQTTRSGGKGGQNVNKVETAVIASIHIEESSLLSAEQKIMVQQKLANRINTEGFLQVKSQTHRTQLDNKEDAVKKINAMITLALQKKKMRVPSKPSKAAKRKRLEGKTKLSERKQGRKKLRPGDF